MSQLLLIMILIVMWSESYSGVSPEIQHPWFFDVDIADRGLRCQFSGFIDTMYCEYTQV